MQFRDLKRQYQVLKSSMDEAVMKVMTDCNFISGQQVTALEERLAKYVGVSYCVACANGTDALTLAMKVLGVKPGDAVFVPDFTFFSTGEVVSFEGATPVFVDVKKDSYNMDPESLKSAIKAVKAEGKLNLKAVIPVDLFGRPYDVDEINYIAHENGMKVVEDGAQGFGGKYKGRRACSLGDIATTSFFPAKPLGCYGDGGAVFTNSKEEYDLLKSLTVHGKGSFKYDNVRIGMNSRLDTIQAAVLDVKMDAFEKYELNDVNKAANWYDKYLSGKVYTPIHGGDYYSSWAQYTIQLKDRNQRDGLQAYLKEKGIPTMVYYPKALHKQQAFDDVKKYIECPVTDVLTDCVLALPMHPYMDEVMCKSVAEEIINYIDK